MPTSIANPISDLREIRSIMERSRYFVGLSGLSGVGAGLTALAGVAVVVAYQWAGGRELVFIGRDLRFVSDHPWGIGPLPFLVLMAVATVSLALVWGYVFTGRRARRLGMVMQGPKLYQLAWHLSFPLLVGGVFCLALIYHAHGGLIGPTTLIFYGLGLINGSRYAREELSYLGYLEVALGLVNLFFIGYGLHFWAVGFGLFHIGYGAWMYQKYDRA